MNLYSITNKTSAQHLGTYLGMDVADAIDAMACDAGYDSQAHAAASLGTTVAALNADLIVAEHDYADDLVRLADAMVDDDRTLDACTVDVLDDPDAGGSDHWDRLGIICAAERIGVSRSAVAAIGIIAIRDAYAAAWRAAVELELSSRDEVAS
jgi:hypothetical protein